ncbi:hypothetical protein F3Y22_tig00008673pilonHSYRG00006 [Hibiscus syriacus]|uniref:Uncharacterized protein n=1 Tax=Hibiscus syriacus TaxID=106335 RepID=A0A6A3C9X0_HIBSY|nr:uncharacterized protein LOC120202369 [Hibiscus syriacus]KAE8725504.1 hypothetical protein F3Y22_tig00008673pilonHSYRG00006 [Hibiscus syriacus]
MARKKSTNKSKDPMEQNPPQDTQEHQKDSTFTQSSSSKSSMEDPSRKLQNLQSLQDKLLNEIEEKEQRIPLLYQYIEFIMATMNESESLELQHELLWVYMATQMRQMVVGTERVIEALDSRANELLDSLQNEREEFSLVYKQMDFARNEGSLRKEMITVMEVNERKLAEEIKKSLEERDAATTVLDMNKKELKDILKKIHDFLGDEATGESENCELQEDASVLWIVVNRLLVKLQNSLLETKSSSNDLREKMESTSIRHGRLLTLLNNTASLLYQSTDEKVRKEKEEAPIADKKPEEEVEQIATDLKIIKQAFKNEETVTQGLKLKAEAMEKTIVESHKKNSFLKFVSSSTIMAAVAFAYATK